MASFPGIMTQFFAAILLLMMILPALLALGIGARSAFGYIWNGMWFLAMGRMAAIAFDAPNAESLGWILFGIFIWRSLVFRSKSAFFFQRSGNIWQPGVPGWGPRPAGGPRDVNGPGSSPHSSGRTRSPNANASPRSRDDEPAVHEVLEAEVIDVSSNQTGPEQRPGHPFSRSEE